MFAGIVENVGEVLSLNEIKEAWELRLSLPFADGEGLARPGADNPFLLQICLFLNFFVFMQINNKLK